MNILVLGIGNLLWADEGFGVRAVESLHRHYQVPPDVTLLDGGTQGLYLLQYVQEADKLLIFDAIDYGLVPGTLKLVCDAEVPNFLGAKKMSLHQVGFQETLAASQLTGHYPSALRLIGVQPLRLEDYGGSLSDPVRAQLEPALQLGLEILASWGVTLVPREQPLSPEQSLSMPGLDLDSYESGRPYWE